jgi:hypothetical protein
MHTRSFAVRLAVLALSLFVAAGCGSSGEDRTPVFPVKGKVTVGGKVPERAQVVFHPLADAGPNTPRPTATVGPDGTFTLSTYTEGDGAPAGDYTVTIVWPESASAIGGDADTGGDRLGGRYANPKSSGLKAKVAEGQNDLPPFVLK